MENNIAVSMFSGCGGLDLGLERAGFEVAVASDLWDEAMTTYEHNFSSETITEDVHDITKADIEEELQKSGYSTTDVTLVAGGPPCQGFSRLNNNQIELDEMEKDNRNTLFHEFLRLAEAIEPQVILMENVRDLINRETSDGTYVKDNIVSEFESAGYNCEYRVIEAEDHGVPQKRRRIFFIGVPEDSDLSPSELFPEPTHDDSNYNTAGDALDGVDDSLPNMNYTNSSASTLEKIRHIPQGGYYKDLPDRLKTKKYRCGCDDTDSCDHEPEIVKRYGTYLRRLDADEPSLTINTNTFIHPTEDRKVTPREMARLQTFPDNFRFYGNKGDVIQQIGNAVPVSLGEAIGEAIRQNS